MNQLEAFARDPWTGTTFRVERSPAYPKALKMAEILDQVRPILLPRFFAPKFE